MSPGPAALADLAELHAELRSVARDLLGRATPLVGHGSAPPPVDWAQLAEMGWLGLEVPEALGGSGATFAEVAVVLQEMGRAAAVGPYLGTAVLGVGALNLTVGGPVRDELLGEIATGRARVATIVGGGDGGASAPSEFVLRRTVDGWVVDGGADLVLDAPAVEHLLVVTLDDASGGRPVLVQLDVNGRGVDIVERPLVDATRTAGSVMADGAPVAPEHVFRFAGDAEAAVATLADRGAVAVACDASGVAGAMLDATVAYAGVRHQFGRPIGSFQAVKHQCADLLVRITVADELLTAAVAAVASGELGAAAVPAAMAKAYLGDAAVDVAGTAMQLHGGIGYAWESGVHVYLKRATLDRSLFGSPTHHRRRLGARYGSLRG